jgi:hypothetical protein
MKIRLKGLEMLEDMLTLWGYKTDSDFSTVHAEMTPEDYVNITLRNGKFTVEVYDTPTKLLRDLGDFFASSKTPAEFILRAPSTKKRKFNGRQ